MGISWSKKTVLAGVAFFLVLIILTPVRLHAQELFRFQKVDTLFEQADAELQAYGVYAFDIQAFRDAVEGRGDGAEDLPVSFQVPGFGNYEFYIRPHDIRGTDYQLTIATEQGISILPRSANKTYRGTTQQFNRDVRFTLDTGFMSGFIELLDDRLYVESASRFAGGGVPGDYVIIYTSGNVIQKADAVCIEGEHHGSGHRNRPVRKGPSRGSRTSACLELEVNLANDFQMYQEYGSSVNQVENQNLSVLNDVETNYDNEFNDAMQFVVNEIFVSTCSTCDPWPGTDDIGTVLSSFRDWAPNGFSQPHDVATLWSPRNFTDPEVGSGVIGLAYVGVVCSSFKYNVCEDYSNNANNLRVLQAHEMGHNFDANHDGQGEPYIMAPSVTNTNDWSVDSENTINTYISSLNCLGPCSAGSAPTAAFDSDVTNGCTPLQVSFNDLSQDIPTSWLWTFEGGTPATSTLQDPVVTYSTPGLYSVTLEVTNNFGSDVLTVDDFITVSSLPTADFVYSVNNFSVSFTNFSDGFDQVSWDFGDGFFSNEVNPVHIYDEDGVYSVTLTASNPCGVDEYTQTLEIITMPVAGFSADQTTGCEPLSVQFFNQSSINVDEYLWIFEGGIPSSSAAENPVVQYDEPGLYSVTLLVTNDIGSDQLTINEFIDVQPLPSAGFTYEVQGDIVTFIAQQADNLSFAWEFGDGTQGTGVSVVHTYPGPGTYDVMLVTSNPCGNDTAFQTINLQGAPSPGFSASAAMGCVPFQVQFVDESSGQVDLYSWVFEGGIPSTSTSANPVVVYNQPGSYDVQLTVTNSFGSETITFPDYISVSDAPAADFQFDVNGRNVVFTNSSSGGDSYLWNFGDGWNSNQFAPSHTYSEDGVYEVSLQVTNGCGSSTVIRIVEIATPPEAALGFDQSTGCEPFTVEFTNQSSPNATQFNWFFEGGIPSTSTEENPVVVYASPGIYSVELEVSSNGGTDLILMNNVIQVFPQPDAAFSVVETGGLEVRFSNQSEHGDSYLWSFGDGITSTEPEPVHTYGDFGTYLVQLIVTNGCGSDTMTSQLNLSAGPVAQFTASSVTGCTPLQVEFEDQSSNQPTSWNWLFPGGNPASSTQQNPVVTYQAPGVYRVELVAGNEAGTSEIIREDFIVVESTPAGSFDYAIEGNLVQFRNTSFNATSVLWQFGNGTSSNLDEVEIEYQFDGEYEVVMIVENGCGKDTVTKTIVIGLTGTADLSSISHVTVFPNPSTGRFRIQPAHDEELFLKVRCINALGQVVFDRAGMPASGKHPLDLDLSGQESGLYYLVLSFAGGKEIIPVVIQE